MNNFFYNTSDFAIFKRALKNTSNDPVVINILSTDESLQKNEERKVVKTEHKNFSNRFEPSPFGKFFGPQKKRTAPVDTNDFSSWKSKNYRKTEQEIDETETSSRQKFSLADYMNQKFGRTKYNDMDEIKSTTQKPITQLSSDDEQLKKFSLNSFMNKLEQQKKVDEDLKDNDDILEQFNSDAVDGSQDENFDYTNQISAEEVSLDSDLAGEKYSLEKGELDNIKSRIEKLEEERDNILKESQNLQEKPEEEEFVMKFDDEDEESETFDAEEMSEEANNEPETSDEAEKASEAEPEISDETEETVEEEDLSAQEQSSSGSAIINNDRRISRDEIISDSNQADTHDEFTDKYGVLVKKSVYETQQPSEYYDYQQEMLQSKIDELIEANKQADELAQKRVQQAEDEKLRAEEDYREKLREIEESFNKKYEEYRKQTELDSLSVRSRIAEAERNIISGSTENVEKRSKKSSLKNELKKQLVLSNNEMDNKLLEYASERNNNASITQRRRAANKEETQKIEVPINLPVPEKKHRKKKTKRRRIDGDIISSVDFD